MRQDDDHRPLSSNGQLHGGMGLSYERSRPARTRQAVESGKVVYEQPVTVSLPR